MAYDRVVIMNPSTGTAETFRVRISRQAVIEWVAEREALTAAGFPDRPPDVDLPTIRTWVQHPGEEQHPYFTSKVEGDPAWPIWTSRWHGGEELDISIGLFWSVDHYGIHVLATGTRVEELHWPDDAIHENGQVRSDRTFPADHTEDEVWGSFELLIAAFNEASDQWPEKDPLVTDYTDYVVMDMEVELAKADIARGFISPMAEAHD